MIERNDTCSELGHSSSETAGTAGDIQYDVPLLDGQKPLRSWLDQDGLKVIPITDAVIPPAGIGIPYPAVLFRVFGKLEFLFFVAHVVSSPCPFGISAFVWVPVP
jgi:hypothetical protein